MSSIILTAVLLVTVNIIDICEAATGKAMRDRVAKLEERMSGCEEIITAHKEKIADNKLLLLTTNQEILDQKKTIVNSEIEISVQKQTITALSQEILAQKDKMVTYENDILAQKENNTALREEMLAQKENNTALKQQILAQKEKMARYEQEIGEVKKKSESAVQPDDTGRIAKELLPDTVVHTDNTGKIEQSLLPGSYSNYSVEGILWGTQHRAGAAACHKFGGKWGRVVPITPGDTCSTTCESYDSRYSCSGVVQFTGRMGHSTTKNSDVGHWFSGYDCGYTGYYTEVSTEKSGILDYNYALHYCCCTRS